MKSSKIKKQKLVEILEKIRKGTKVSVIEEVLWWIPVAKISLSISNFAAEIFSNNKGFSPYYVQCTKHTKAIIYPIVVEFVFKM